MKECLAEVFFVSSGTSPQNLPMLAGYSLELCSTFTFFKKTEIKNKKKQIKPRVVSTPFRVSVTQVDISLESIYSLTVNPEF